MKAKNLRIYDYDYMHSHVREVYPFLTEDDKLHSYREVKCTCPSQREGMEEMIKDEQERLLNPDSNIRICLHTDSGLILTFSSDSIKEMTKEEINDILHS